MEVNLVEEAVKFMLLGMGTVFVFLIVMIMSMNAQSWFVHKFLPDAPKEPDVAPTMASNNNSKAAAITAAIIHHQNDK